MYVSLKLPDPSKTLTEKSGQIHGTNLSRISLKLSRPSQTLTEKISPDPSMLHVDCPAPPLDVVLNLRFQRPAARDEMEGRMRYMDVYLSGSQALISPVDMSMNLWPWHVSVLETNLCLGLIELQVARFSFSSLTILG